MACKIVVMKSKSICLLVVSLLLLSCGTSKTKATPEQIEALHRLVESKSFRVESEWALPFLTNSMVAVQNAGVRVPGNSANRISLLEIPNTLQLKQNAISSQLPYYGEIQMPSGYMNTDQNDIVFEGEISNYKVVQHDNNSYTLRFDARSHNENYDVTITLFPNMRSEMVLRGAKRDPIRYSGRIRPISE